MDHLLNSASPQHFLVIDTYNNGLTFWVSCACRQWPECRAVFLYVFVLGCSPGQTAAAPWCGHWHPAGGLQIWTNLKERVQAVTTRTVYTGHNNSACATGEWLCKAMSHFEKVCRKGQVHGKMKPCGRREARREDRCEEERRRWEGTVEDWVVEGGWGEERGREEKRKEKPPVTNPTSSRSGLKSHTINIPSASPHLILNLLSESHCWTGLKSCNNSHWDTLQNLKSQNTRSQLTRRHFLCHGFAFSIH